jgi:serine protease Do
VKKYILALAGVLIAIKSWGLSFDFSKLDNKAREYTVAVNMTVEISLGMQSTETQDRIIGTVVSKDGLVIFDGTALDGESPFSMMSGMQIDTKPKSVEIVMMDGTKYPADYIGTDRYTHIGFCKINSDKKKEFKFVDFKKRDNFRVGEWLAVYLLMPEYIEPSLAADVGMVASLIKIPEDFALTVGFNDLEMTSVLYDSLGSPVGVLGELSGQGPGFESGQMMQSMSQSQQTLPLLGVIPPDKLEKLFANPPKKGEINRGWLGIYMQVLTSDLADYWGLNAKGGIIINEVAKDSPADSAGLKTGDIMIKIDGKEIGLNKEENMPIFQRQIAELGAGAKANFEILRRQDGKIDTLNLQAVLAAAPLSPSEAPQYKDTNFDLTLRNMVFADYNINNLDRRQFKGVVVKELESGGWAAVGEIMPGDIIQAIDGKKVTSVDDAKEVFSKIAEKKPKEVVFFIWRDNKTSFANIKTEW